MRPVLLTAITLSLASNLSVRAECPLDHFIIGCNRDGIKGTPDDRVPFVDCCQKYRNSSATPYGNWFYPLQESIIHELPVPHRRARFRHVPGRRSERRSHL